MKRYLILLTLLSALAASAGTVAVSWDPPTDNTTGWIVYEQIGTTWTLAARCATTNATFLGVLSGDHTYSVTATNAAGLESPRSAPGTGRVLPNSPTGTTIKISAAVQ